MSKTTRFDVKKGVSKPKRTAIKVRKSVREILRKVRTLSDVEDLAA